MIKQTLDLIPDEIGSVCGSVRTGVITVQKPASLQYLLWLVRISHRPHTTGPQPIELFCLFVPIL